MRQLLIAAMCSAVIASASYAAGSTYKRSSGFRFSPPKNGFFTQPTARTARSTATVTRTNRKKTGFSTFFNKTR